MMPATTTATKRRTDRVRAARQQARDGLWRAGDLTWLLDYGKADGPQRDFYEKSKACSGKTFVSEDARRLGKSVALVIIAFELALKHPGSRINWCQDTSKGVRSSAVKTMQKISRTAPVDCRGRFNSQLSSFIFPNGSYIFIFGGNTEEDADTARGGDDPIASFFDEAGYMRYLKYIYRSIVKHGMRLIRRKGHFGMIFVSSSTPEEMDHYFITLANVAETRGRYIRRTIYASADAERHIAEEAADAGITVEQYRKTDDFLRELMCERIVDQEKVIFPEFHAKKDVVVREHQRPIGFDRYIYRRVSVDLGGTVDKYGFLYGYVDFIAAKIVIEDERVLERPNTRDIARELSVHEQELWPDANPQRITRVIDDDTERTIRDLYELHKVSAVKAVKHDRDASINLARMFIGNEKLVIHPRCVELRRQLLAAIPNKRGTDYERTESGHFDLCASLQYFVRDLSLTINPYPPDYDVIAGRKLPEHHPSVARAEVMGVPSHQRGIAAVLLGQNRFVQAGLAKRRG
jgi:hypothetical protein